MDKGASKQEGPHSFDLRGLVPLIAFAVELCLKYLPERQAISDVVEAYIKLFGETDVALFLEEHSDWISNALETGLQVVLV